MVILDVGGRDELLSHDLLEDIDIISPNETELERVIHKKVSSDDSLKQEIVEFISKYPKIKLLLKQGEHGSAFYSMDENQVVTEIHKPAYSFKDHPDLKLVDTTGAGDCFTGAFAL